MPPITFATRVARTVATAIGISSVLWLAACGNGSPTAAEKASTAQSSTAARTRPASSSHTSTHTSTASAVSSAGTLSAGVGQTGGTRAAAHTRRQPVTSSTSSATDTRSTSTTSTATTSQTSSASSALPNAERLRTAFANAAEGYATCLRKHGVHVPTSSAAGHGTAPDLGAVDTASAQYARASADCRSVVARALREAVSSATSTTR